MPNLTTQAINLYTERQLMDQSRRIYEEPLPPLNGFELLPPEQSVSLGAAQYNRRVYKHFGKPEWVGHAADDLPRADVAVIEDVYNVGMYGIAYEYSLQEKRRAAFANAQLEDRRGRAARRGMLEFANDVLWYGSVAKQLFGILSFPYTPRVTLDKDLFKVGADSDATLDALYNLEEFIEDFSDGAERPNTLALAYDEYNYISRTRVSSLNDQTILQVFLKNAQFVTSVVKVRELNSASAAGTNMMAMLSIEGERAEHIMPDPLTILAPQLRNLATVVNMVAETGGFASEFPYAHILGEMDE